MSFQKNKISLLYLFFIFLKFSYSSLSNPYNAIFFIILKKKIAIKPMTVNIILYTLIHPNQ